MARSCFIAWALLLAACSGAGPASAPGAAQHTPGSAQPTPGAALPLDILHASESDRGFARALSVRPFEFPQDHGPHPSYRLEWWYFTGHLRSTGGERFGFELTFFRVALAPPDGSRAAADNFAAESTPDAAAPASSWRTRQIYVADFAVTDVARKTFHSAERFARDAQGLAGARATPFRVWLGGWSVAADEGERTEGPRAPGTWTLRAADPAYALTLQLRPLSPPVLNGDHGLSVKANVPGSASYYYSIPRLAARGRISRGARAMDVIGTAWLDREWGSGALGPNEQGWDWFALQLDDGSALMFYTLRDVDGASDSHSAGTWIAADGSTRALSSDDVRIDVLSHWRSPHGIFYPSQWRIRVSSLGLDVEATPVLANQELETKPLYWEGDVDVSGMRNGQAAAGQGYVELVGYPER